MKDSDQPPRAWSVDRWPLWLVIVFTAVFYSASKSLLDTQKPIPGTRWLLGEYLRTSLMGAVPCALQIWSRHLRQLGFALLLWIPCFAATLFAGFLGAAPVAGGTGGGIRPLAQQLLAVAFVEAVAITVWGLPWLGRLLSGGDTPPGKQ